MAFLSEPTGLWALAELNKGHVVHIHLDEDSGIGPATHRMAADGDEAIVLLAGCPEQIGRQFIEPATTAGFEFAADDEPKHRSADDTPGRYAMWAGAGASG
ncbi:MAG: hypothetical protein ACYDAL_02630 [Candidatus Dormibacteraceae bacterium]